LSPLGTTGSGYETSIAIGDPELEMIPPPLGGESVGSLPSEVRIEELGVVTKNEEKSRPYSVRYVMD
jgi:hypothetical protein